MILNTIISFLDEKSANYEIVSHQPVYTSEQAAGIRGLGLESGAKSLLLKVNGDFIMFVLPGNLKLNSKKLKNLTKAKKIRFATPNEVEEITGTQIGAVYPFGNIAGVRMYVDQNLGKNDIIAFNPGVHDKSIIKKWTEYQKATNCQVVDISEDQA